MNIVETVANGSILWLHRMKHLVVLAVLFGFITTAVHAEGTNLPPFQTGEKLTYQIYWGPFIGGRATLEVTGIEPVDGHDCYRIVAHAETTGLADFLFHVDSTSESWLDTQDLCTRRYRENRVEGKSKQDNETVYDYVKKEAVTTNHRNGKKRHTPLPGPVVDVISSLYYIRTKPLALNTPQTFAINTGDTNRTVNLVPDTRKSLYIRPLGDVNALRMEPKPTMNIVSKNGGRLLFWISDDAKKIPVLVTSEMKIGSAKLVLSNIEHSTPVAAATPQRVHPQPILAIANP